MVLLKLVFIICVWKRVLAEDVFPNGIQPPTPKQMNELGVWNENSQQNIWELSGQFQGDIVFSKNQRNGIVYTQYTWPSGILPYEIDQTAFDNTKIRLIEDALARIASVTCIRPRRRLPSDENYVFVTNKWAGCWSYIGRVGRGQYLNLGNGCLYTGVILHEFLHALGFFHQQSDSTRDYYVKIFLNNVYPGYEGNFNKYPSNVVTSFGEPYDYESIMHYSRKAFSKNGKDTIIPTNPYAQIGVRGDLSAIDIKKIKKMYRCPW